MTREEAIKELKEDKMLYETDLCHAGDGSPDGQLLEALDMAIEALSADAVSREGCDCVFSKPKIKLPKKAVEFNFSNIEVVVRCKDCVWGKEWNDKQIFCERILMRLRETDFCSYGERESNDIRKSNNADKNTNR